MLLPRLLAPVRACAKPVAPLSRVLDALRAPTTSTTTTTTTTPTLALTFIRNASHQSQGRANGAKDGPGKRLGAKKTGGEYVIPGNIIFRQRGTAWFPGENCKFGRDHCIFATESGYVRYYRDPRKHPKRQYIGVALEKDHTLPYPPNAVRRRRLNMLAVPSEPETDAAVVVEPQLVGVEAEVGGASEATMREKTARGLTMSKGYAYREANWEIGRAAERANVQVKKFVPGDRWTAWRKSNARIEANEERKRLRNAGKKAAKPKQRQQRQRA